MTASIAGAQTASQLQQARQQARNIADSATKTIGGGLQYETTIDTAADGHVCATARGRGALLDLDHAAIVLADGAIATVTGDGNAIRIGSGAGVFNPQATAIIRVAAAMSRCPTTTKPLSRMVPWPVSRA